MQKGRLSRAHAGKDGLFSVLFYVGQIAAAAGKAFPLRGRCRTDVRRMRWGTHRRHNVTAKKRCHLISRLSPPASPQGEAKLPRLYAGKANANRPIITGMVTMDSSVDSTYSALLWAALL